MNYDLYELLKNAEEIGRLKENNRILTIVRTLLNDGTIERIDVLERLINEI